MRKKFIIICSVIFLLGIIVILKFDKNDNDDTTDEINKVIDTIDSNQIEDIDFSSYEEFDINLTETLTIKNGGVYNLTGNINDGQILIDTKDNVKLVLNNVNIKNSTGPAIMVENANVVYIELKSGSVNSLSDSDDYIVDSDNEPNGTIFSKDDLVLLGSGKLVINANYEDAIVSKDNLKIINGNYEINAVSDGIRGKDSLVIKNGIFNINASQDCLKSTNSSDTNLGYILIEGGKFNLEATNDGIQTETNLVIEDGDFDIKTGGGSDNLTIKSDTFKMWQDQFRNTGNIASEEEESSKGLKAGKNIIINNGTYTINSIDDSIHSNSNITITDGTFKLKAGDDGIHADSEIIINDGDINIEKSYEGIEAQIIKINGGTIKILSNDDGFNAASKDATMSLNGRSNMDNFNENSDSKIEINDGNIYINASGDGIDANGIIYVNGGTTIVNGPIDSGNGALDYNQELKITGGIFVASGSSGMSQGPSSSSTQNSIVINFSTKIKTLELVSIFNSNDEEIFTYKASNDYQNLVISLPDFQKNKSYTIYTGGSSTGKDANGLFETGYYQKGTKYEEFKIEDVITNIGNYKGMNQGMSPNMQGGIPDNHKPMKR